MSCITCIRRLERLVWDLMQVSGEKTRLESARASKTKLWARVYTLRMNSSKAFSTSREKFLFKFTVFCLMRRLFVLCQVKERGLMALKQQRPFGGERVAPQQGATHAHTFTWVCVCFSNKAEWITLPGRG